MAQQAGSIAQVYAQALFDVAAETDAVSQTEEELLGLKELVSKDARLRLFLDAPSVPFEAKAKVLRGALAQISKPVLNFLLLLIEHQRMGAFAQVVDAYHRTANHKAGIAEFGLESARALTPDQLDRLTALLAAKLKRKIVVQERVRPELLGGFVLSHDGKVWDTTIARKLAGAIEKMDVVHSSIAWTE